MTATWPQIVAAAQSAHAAGAGLVVFSELCVMGYPARDLLEKPAFLAAQRRALERLCRELPPNPVLLGAAMPNTTGIGCPLHNAALLIRSGRVDSVGCKSLLPTYDVFDEDRYFEPAAGPALVEIGGVKVGLTVCEDAWNDKDFWAERKYVSDPVATLCERGAQLLVNLSASPFSVGKHALKLRMLGQLARKHGVPLIYVNQVGGNDDLVFDGRSLAFNAAGSCVYTGAAFETGIGYVTLNGTDLETNLSPQNAVPSQQALNELEEIRRALVLGTRDYARKCGFKTAVLGLSGGIDSALVAALAAEAFGPENVTGVAMPSKFNAPESLNDARTLAESVWASASKWSRSKGSIRNSPRLSKLHSPGAKRM